MFKKKTNIIISVLIFFTILIPIVKNKTRLIEKNKTSEILKLAVKRMLPGGPLAKKQLTKLKIYSGDKHPHEVQNPTVINFKDLNFKIQQNRRKT